jgi:hypothetical protein
MNEESNRGGISLDWRLNIGHLVQITLLLLGLVSWALSSANRAETAQRDLGSLKTDVASQLRDLRDGLGRDLSALNGEVRGLSDQRPRLDGLEKWTAQNEAQRQALETRLTGIERMAIELRTELNGIRQASSARLPLR